MQKFYYRLLGAVIILGFIINISSFCTGFNPKQLINIAFFKERALAEVYLLKHIILDSGIYLKYSTIEELAEFTKKAADEYSVDKNLLLIILNPKNEFQITLTGGMGLSSICGGYFQATNFSDPFNPEQNIYAAANAIKTLIDSGTPERELPSAFLLCSKNKKIENLYPNVFENAIKLDSIYEGIINANG